MHRFLKTLVIALFFMGGGQVLAQAQMPQHPQGKVNDYAQVLTPTDKIALERLSEDLENRQGAQLAVVTVVSLEGVSVEEYANKLFNLWGIGHKGKDDGVLLLVAPREHKVRIEVGYGLEGVLNDAKTGRILDEAVLPYFKASDYSQGILHGCQRIVAELGEENPPNTAVHGPGISLLSSETMITWLGLLAMGFFFGFSGLGFLRMVAGYQGQRRLLMIAGLVQGIFFLLCFIGVSHSFHWLIYALALISLTLIVAWLFREKILKTLVPKVLFNFDHEGSGRGGFGSGGSGSSSGGFGGGSSGGGGSSRSW